MLEKMAGEKKAVEAPPPAATWKKQGAQSNVGGNLDPYFFIYLHITLYAKMR